MQLKFLRRLALSLALLFIAGAGAGCADNTMDILGKVGETPIYRWYYNAYLINQLEAYLQQTGVNLTEADKRSELRMYKQYRLTDLVGEFALREEARKQGFDKLTAEQEREVDLQYQEYYDSSMAGFIEQYGADENGRKQAEQAYIDMLKRSTLTPERLRQNYRDQYVLKLFVESIIQQEPITDEEIKTYYEEHKESDRVNWENNPAWYGENATEATVYIPEGYVETARIMKKFTDDQRKRLQEPYSKVAYAQTAYFTEITTNGPDTADAKRLLDALNKADEAYNAMLETCYEEISVTMQQILDEVTAGADFIKTLEAKSDDVRRIAYMVCEESTHVEDAYREAALQLTQEGALSGIVRMEEGVCIIRRMEAPAPGIRPIEDVYEAIRTHLQATRSMTTQLGLMEDYALMAEDAGIVELYMDKL